MAAPDDQLTLPLPGLRDWRDDAALRPQPKRAGLDDWATPACLCAALTHDVLPTLPPGAVWEPAPGGGALVGAIAAAGRRAVTTTADFKRCAAPAGARILATNPPFLAHSMFVERSMALLESGALDAVVLLFRTDHIQSESRTPPRCRIDALNKVAAIFFCPWRPIWIANTSGNGRWGFHWLVWLRAGVEGPHGNRWLTRRTR
jgi:hypothetical protein